MGIGDYIVLAIILYLLFRIVRYILVSVWLWLVTIWIRWKFRHVVLLTQEQHRAISKVYENQLREASRQAAREIIRRK
jgi:hypothetical protein